MTTLDLTTRLRAAASTAQAQPEVCPIDGPCRCPTCAIVEVLIQGQLVSDGFSRNEAERVTVGASRSEDYIAAVRVDGREVYRIISEPDAALQSSVMADIKQALED